MNMLSGISLRSMLAATGTLLLLSGSPVSALIFENFNSDTPGAPPANGTISLGADGVVSVVGAGTTPPDPFGGGGNQSLYFNQPGTPFSQVTFTGAATGEGLASGTASVRFYPEAGARAFLRLQDAAGTAAWGPYIQISTTNRLHFYNGAAAILTEQSWITDEINELVISWMAGTYTGELNGVPVTTSDGQSVFNFFGTPATISQAVLRVGGASGDTIVFFDDLVVVPEPATTSLLLGGAVLVGLLAFRRCRQRGIKKA